MPARARKLETTSRAHVMWVSLANGAIQVELINRFTDHCDAFKNFQLKCVNTWGQICRIIVTF